MKIGRDEVYLEDGRLVIHAARPMDWPIREFCRVPIWFQGQKYYLRGKHQGSRSQLMVYELWAWPEDLHEASTREVVYDEAYVAARDKEAAAARHNGRLHLALCPLYPVLGLFWSGFKNRVLGPVGFEPGSITRVSIALIFNLFVLETVFAGWLAGGVLMYFLGQPELRAVDLALALVLGADSVMRFGQSLKLDVDRHWGFCEWLWQGRR